MKNAIKVLCFTLAVMVVIVSSFLIYFKWDKTDFEYVDSTEKGEVIITAYKGDSKNIIIPSKIRGKKVTQIDSGILSLEVLFDLEFIFSASYILLKASLFQESDPCDNMVCKVLFNML